MKKWLISLLFVITLCALRFADPWFMEIMRLKALDTHQRNQQTQILDPIVTVEIDNKTIRKNGQWPWSRDILGKEIEHLYKMGAGMVVVPILFADPDRFGKDLEFAKTLTRGAVVVGQIPANETKGNPTPRGVATIGTDWKPWIYTYKSAVGPIKIISENAAGVGMMNTTPEADGVVRRLPLVVQIGGKLYPSISLETLRVAAGDPSYQMKTGEGGVEAVRIPKFSTVFTDQNASIWVDFKYKTKTYSMSDELPDLSGKIVILSLTASGVDTVIPTPVGAIYAHDLIATSIATMMAGTNITRPYWTTPMEIVVTFAIGFILLTFVLRMSWYYSAVLLPTGIVGLYYASSYLFTKYGFLVDWSFPIFAVFVTWSIAAFLRFMEEYKQKMQIKKQFGTYLSPAMVEKLQKNPELLALGGETRDLSIMFTDVRGFTTISEHYGKDVQGLTQIMNRYMTAMSQSILDNEGTIDKYIGDAQMAFWNAPLDDNEHADHAVHTAIEMVKKLKEFNDEIANDGVPAFGMGVGVNSGDVVVGNMGSTQRFDYTCLGDTVNLASRLEGQSKTYGVDIVLGEETVNKLQRDWFLLELDLLVVKGKSEPVKIFTVLDKAYESAKKDHIKFLELYRDQDWPMARRWAEEQRGEFDGKMSAYYSMMIDRIQELRKKPKVDNWSGVYVATTK